MAELEGKLLQVIQRTPNVKSFRVEAPERADFKAGQFLHVKLGEQKELRRYLSISNSPTEKGYIEFTKKITESNFSRMLDEARPGQRIRIEYPLGAFTFGGEYGKIAFLSGGIGITPIRSIIKFVIDKNLGTDMVLIYANRTIQDIVFKEDLDNMRGEYQKLKLAYVISQPEPQWTGEKGRINAGIIRGQIPDYAERRFYICGPPAMVEAMKQIMLEELKLSKESIVQENFTGY
ncbi:ferredoxin--NADP reductase [Candidatus Omnitrophota bacterium]